MNQSGKIYYYTSASGENPFSKFLDSLAERRQRKILRILTAIEAYGLNTAIPHTKKMLERRFGKSEF